MKKLFLLIPAMLLTVMAYATSQTISPSSEESDSNIRSALSGSADTIILNEGNYKEADQIHFRRNAVIMAAEGAEVIITPKYYCDFVNANTKVKIIGIKFDGSVSGQQAILASDANVGKELRLENCEFYNFTKDAVGTYEAAYTMDSCIVTNCYFHDNNRSSLYFIRSSVEGKQTIYGLKVTNSTFAKINVSSEYRSVIDVCSYASDGSHPDATDDIEVVVDHCTFYNNTTMNYDYSAIRTRIVNKTTVSNCIFAHPSAIEFYATNLWAGSVTNCLAYNFNKGYNAPTKTEANTGNPIFNDLANNKYTYDGNWLTGSISPARGAATDGSDLGDPKWYSAETLPSSDFASAYDLLPTKAQFAGTVEKNASDKIHYTNTSTETNGKVKWKLNVTKTCIVSAVVDVEADCESGRQLTLTVKDADGNTVATLAQESATYNDADINLGSLNISEEGDYTFILTNSHPNSSVVLEKITLAYLGGDTQTITNTADFETDIDDAWFSSNGTRADGKISFPGSTMASAWVRWNVHVSNNDYYDVTVNFDKGDADHNCGVKLYNDLTTVFDKHATTSSQTGAASPIRLGRFFLPAGDYIMEFTNPVTNSTAKLISVEAKAFVAPVVALPNTLPASSAITSELAYEDGGELYFTPSDRKGYILDQWVKWKVSVAAAGAFLFTMDVNSDNEQSYKITILDNENNELDFFEKNPSSGARTIQHYFNLAAGNYFVMVQNTTNHSAGHIVSMVVSQPAGIVTIDEAATSIDSWADKVVDKDADGPYYDVQIIRTIKAGMYNTLCLPFAVTSTQCKDIFGADVQIRTLESSTIEEGDFVLNLNFKVASDIYPGTPILIQTSRDIVNPVFTGVKFVAAAPATSTTARANFIGNFAKGTIPASENNLFMGANNTLYFPTVDTEILGMRGYFVIQDAPAGVIQRAQIVEADAPAVTTDIVIVKSQESGVKSQKLIKDGQLIIIRDGVRYNVMGTKIQ